jgi:hypothetical protein
MIRGWAETAIAVSRALAALTTIISISWAGHEFVIGTTQP